jgi:hypothetical protein
LGPHLAVLTRWIVTMPELTAKLNDEKNVTAHPASVSRLFLKAAFPSGLGSTCSC